MQSPPLRCKGTATAGRIRTGGLGHRHKHAAPPMKSRPTTSTKPKDMAGPYSSLMRELKQYHGAVEANPTGNHGVSGSVPSLAQWVKNPMLLGAVV